MKKFWLNWFKKYFTRTPRVVLLYTTFPDQKSAEKAVSDLLQEKLIACANFHKIESHYFWEEAITNKPEIATLLKTSPRTFLNYLTGFGNYIPTKLPVYSK